MTESSAARLYGLIAETFIHAGIGQARGAIDLPVAREAATDYPYIAGSSFKGALLQAARDIGLGNRETLFGKQENAGALLIGDIRLLFLPVRSLRGAFRWVTCPHVLHRFVRDRARTGKEDIDLTALAPESGLYLGKGQDGERLYLEERSFEWAPGDPKQLESLVNPLFPGDKPLAGVAEKLVVLNDEDFAWFARYALPIQARNHLDETTKTVKEGPWYEEALPPDTVMFAIVGERPTKDPGKPDSGFRALEAFDAMLEKDLHSYLQIGGNETVGQGWFRIAPIGAQP